MKILVLTSVYKDILLGDRDTSTNIVNSFVYDWIKQGHQVVVIHNSHYYPKIIHAIPKGIKEKLVLKMGFAIADYDAVKRKEYYDNGVKVYRLPIKKYIPHKTPNEKEINRQIKRILEITKEIDFVPDVITGHWASPQMEIISKLKNKFNCKTACVLHGVGYVDRSDFDSQMYLKGIDHLGARSLPQAKQIKRLLDLEKMPFVCESGIPDDYLKNYSLYTLKYKHIKKWKFTYVGRLVFYKNIDATIKALAKLESIDWEFDIVGDGPARLQLEAIANKLKCAERIHFKGRVSRNQVMQILKLTHVFIMISTNEVFGLVYLEAMAASCITVASKDGGVDGIIQNMKNGYLCTEGDSYELYEIIKKIFENNVEDNIRMVTYGYRTACRYSDSKMAKEYLDKIIE